MERIKQQYLTIGHEHTRLYIGLMEGNRYGESRIRVVATLPEGTNWGEARDEAERLAGEMGVRLGRNFAVDEWEGKVKA